jgi:hypothetical protein
MATLILDFNLTGDKEVIEALEKLGKDVENQIAQEVCAAAMEPMLKAAEINAASLGSNIDVNNIDMSDLISNNLEIKKFKNKKAGQYGAQVRTKPKVAVFVSGKYYIPFAIEYGHAFPGRGGGKNAAKDVAAVPFMRPAFDSTKEQCLALAEVELKKKIEQVSNF